MLADGECFCSSVWAGWTSGSDNSFMENIQVVDESSCYGCHLSVWPAAIKVHHSMASRRSNLSHFLITSEGSMPRIFFTPIYLCSFRLPRLALPNKRHFWRTLFLMRIPSTSTLFSASCCCPPIHDNMLSIKWQLWIRMYISRNSGSYLLAHLAWNMYRVEALISCCSPQWAVFSQQ